MTKFTRDNLIGILKAIDSTINKNAKYNKFLLYTLQKNRKKLVDLAQEIEQEEKKLYTEEYKKYDAERVAIVKTYSNKDANGEAILDDKGQAQISDENLIKLKADMTILEGKYKTTLEEFNSKKESFVSFINEPIEFEFVKTDFKNLPDEIDMNTFELLSIFVNSKED